MGSLGMWGTSARPGWGPSCCFVLSPIILVLRPTWEDMIIAYSTIPGYASLRWAQARGIDSFNNYFQGPSTWHLVRTESSGSFYDPRTRYRAGMLASSNCWLALIYLTKHLKVDLLRMTSERLSHFTNEQGEKQTCNVEMRSDQDVPVFFTSCLPGTCTRGSTSTLGLEEDHREQI